MFEEAEALLATQFKEWLMKSVGIIRSLNQNRNVAVAEMIQIAEPKGAGYGSQAHRTGTGFSGRPGTRPAADLNRSALRRNNVSFNTLILYRMGNGSNRTLLTSRY